MKMFHQKNTGIMMLVATALAIFIRPASDGSVTVNEFTPFSFPVFVPCAAGGAGEFVDISGTLHTLITVTINGNNVSGVVLHGQVQGISGTGETTGLKYHGTDVIQQTAKGSVQNDQFTATFIERFDVIGQGPGNNFSLRDTAHITSNPNGTVTVVRENLVIDCK